MKYSASTNGFYDDEINAGFIPDDAVDLTQEQYKELIAGQAAGQEIVADQRGFPRLQDHVATEEEINRARNNKARAYLNSTDWYVVRKAETGEEIPQAVLDARAAARASVVE